MCSCRESSIMMEVGQPGELPLMRQLSALKKSRGLRDPATATTPSHKSPALLEDVPATELADPDGEDSIDEQAGNGTGLRSKEKPGAGTSSWKVDGGSQGGVQAQAGRKGSLKSPQLDDINPRMSWDLGKESSGGLDAAPLELQHRQSLKSHLEKLGIFGDSRGLGQHSTGGGKSLLHNWKAADYADDTEEQEDSSLADGLEHEAYHDLQNWPSSRHQSLPSESHPGYFPRSDERGWYKSSHRTSRLAKGSDRSLGQDGQILSPLVLNSHDDMHRFSQPQQLFTLEDPYDDDEQYYLEDEFESGMAEIQFFKPQGSRSRSPFMLAEARRLSKKQGNNTSGRYSPRFTPLSDNTGRRTPSLKPMPWEAEFLEYEVDGLEVPKEGGRSHHRLKSQKQARNQQAAVQDRAFYSDNAKTSRRKGAGAADRPSRLQQKLNSSSYAPTRNQEAEPLPLLTELEDYNGSDEYARTSVDGDCSRLSKSELGGQGTHGSHVQAGRLVNVAENDKLQLAVPECKELALCDYRPRNLSQKYRPKAFEEVVGQNIVTQALSNAILKGKIAPVYLFQGCRGTGKTSAARIFAAALICVSSEECRPCGACRECISVATGKCSEVKEVDAASNNGIEKVKALLDDTICAPSLSRYKVFIIDECHVLTSETWNALLKILEEPPINVVFILITTDPDQLPRTAVSRCQKFPFPKIKDSEIVKRLEKLASMENLDIGIETLQLIASRSDGSLRDAETTLDQVSLLGQEINPSTVYELVGTASDERMLSLLDSALLADTINTVRRARELVDSGVEPLSLMSRLATLITDILAGTYKFTEKQRKGFFRRQTLSEEKLERLRMAMKTLSEAEKQLRVSNDRTTWLTAALLQLGPDRSFLFPASCTGTSVTQSPVALDDGDHEGVDFERNSSGRQTWDDEGNFSQNMSSAYGHSKSENFGNGAHNRNLPPNQGHQWNMSKGDVPSAKMHGNTVLDRPFLQSGATNGSVQVAGNPHLHEDTSARSRNIPNEQILSPTKLDDIWCRVVERCQSLPLRQLLNAHGKLVSISMSEVDAFVHLEVSHPENKSKCERAQKNIAGMFESVLGFPVEVRISLASLPAEEQGGAKPWASSEQSRQSEGSLNLGGPMPTGDRGATNVYSLNSWKHQGSGMNRSGSHQMHVTDCFPAIPQASFGSAPNDHQHFESEGSNWNTMPGADGGIRRGHQALDQPLKPKVLHEGRRFSPLARDDTTLGGPIRVQYPGAFQDVSANMHGYVHNLECDDIYSEGERELDGMETLSPGCHDVINLCDERGLRNDDVDRGLNDGRRSCDTDLQKRKGSSLKMVRRLTMRSRIRSLPSSDPNSPDNKGSSLRVPRFATRSHIHQQNHREGQMAGDSAEVLEQARECMDANDTAALTQKKSKLKGAAGSFARFLQGKLTKQPSDSTNR